MTQLDFDSTETWCVGCWTELRGEERKKGKREGSAQSRSPAEKSREPVRDEKMRAPVLDESDLASRIDGGERLEGEPVCWACLGGTREGVEGRD